LDHKGSSHQLMPLTLRSVNWTSKVRATSSSRMKLRDPNGDWELPWILSAQMVESDLSRCESVLPLTFGALSITSKSYLPSTFGAPTGELDLLRRSVLRKVNQTSFKPAEFRKEFAPGINSQRSSSLAPKKCSVAFRIFNLILCGHFLLAPLRDCLRRNSAAAAASAAVRLSKRGIHRLRSRVSSSSQ
jgi:hypothetical protein